MEIETRGGPAQVGLTIPAGGASFLAVLTHGAGGTPDTADVLAVKDAAESLGAATALVTQPYRVRGARAPGSAVKQDQAWAELAAELRKLTGGVPLVQCGRSNGARVVCRTAQAVGAAGVIALAFPLHPPGHPGKSRAGELAAAGIPVLVINGDRDPFGIPEASASVRVSAPGRAGYPGGAGDPRTASDLGKEAATPGKDAAIRVVVLPGQTHSLAKSPAVIGEIVTEWLNALPGAGRR